MKTVIVIKNNVLHLVCLSILILIDLFGFWPFQLNPANPVSWLPAAPGLRFRGTGHLYMDCQGLSPIVLSAWK